MEKADRVRAVFRGEMPDRIPVCEQVIASSVASDLLGREAYTGSSDVSYREAIAHTEGGSAHAEFAEQVFQDVIDIHRLLDLDILFLRQVGSPAPTKRLDEFSFLYGDPESRDWSIMKFDPDSRQYGVLRTGSPPPTLEQVVDMSRDRMREEPPPPPSLSAFQRKALAEYGDEFVVAGQSFMSVPLQPGWLEATVLEPEVVCDYLDRSVERNLAHMDVQRKAGIWLFNGGGDFACNQGPLYSPAFFHEVMAPRWKRLFDWCREHDAKYIFRSDGNLWPVAEELFAWARPDAYYEIDHDAGMHFDKLRRAFPELVLLGNVSCDVLRRGTVEDVRATARACLEAAAPRAILASANSILHGTPPENVLALYDVARTFRCQASSG